MSIIAYSYEADYHCIPCTVKRFGKDDYGYVPASAKDSEGNDVHAVFSTDEWYEPGRGEMQTLACGTCGDVIETFNDVGE